MKIEGDKVIIGDRVHNLKDGFFLCMGCGGNWPDKMPDCNCDEDHGRYFVTSGSWSNP